MNIPPVFLAWMSLLAASSASLSATILAYDGFATDATGSGVNYEDATLLPGQGSNETRTGFTGDWSALNANLAASINVRSAIGGLSYPGFLPGDSGTANPFRTGARPGGANANSEKWVGRDLSIANNGDYDSGYYVAALVDFNNAVGGGFGWSVSGRPNYLEFDFDNGNSATFTSAGNSGETYSFAPNSSGTNLFVIQFTDQTTGSVTSGDPNPNTSFYSRWNLWVNPDLSGGVLGAETASGWGIGLLNNGPIGDFTDLFVSASNINDAEMFVDELYISTDPSSFIVVPEPGTYALMAGLAVLGAAWVSRRRRSRE